MTVGITELPPEGMQLPGVALAGDPERGTKTTEGISLLFTTAGITVQGPQPQIERLLVWSALDSATCRETVQLPDGREAAIMELTSGGQSIRFLLPSDTVSPGQAAYLDQALPTWLLRYKGARPAPARRRTGRRTPRDPRSAWRCPPPGRPPPGRRRDGARAGRRGPHGPGDRRGAAATAGRGRRRHRRAAPMPTPRRRRTPNAIGASVRSTAPPGVANATGDARPADGRAPHRPPPGSAGAAGSARPAGAGRPRPAGRPPPPPPPPAVRGTCRPRRCARRPRQPPRPASAPTPWPRRTRRGTTRRSGADRRPDDIAPAGPREEAPLRPRPGSSCTRQRPRRPTVPPRRQPPPRCRPADADGADLAQAARPTAPAAPRHRRPPPMWPRRRPRSPGSP